MKLLPKSEFDKKKSEEQRRDVEEGVKLARRIDSLREVISEEEAKRIKYRNEQEETIAKALQEQTTRLYRVKEEADLAEQRRNEALVPLDREREEIRQAHRDLDERGRDLGVREQRIEGMETVARDREARTKELLRDAQIKDSLSNTRFQEADSKHAEAKRALESARHVQELADARIKKEDRDLTHRENLVDGREKNATMKETEIRSREKALAEGFRLLKDREELFARTQKRIQ